MSAGLYLRRQRTPDLLDLQCRYLIPAPIVRTSGSAWLYKHSWTCGDVIKCGDKVAQLVGCRTSNQRVAGSIPGHSGHFGRSWERQFIPYCFSLPSCKMGT